MYFKSLSFFCRFCFLLFIFLTHTACGLFKPDSRDALQKLSVNQYPVFKDDINYIGLRRSVEQSLTYLKKLPLDRTFKFGEDTYDTVHMINSLEQFLGFIENQPNQSEINRFIKSHYAIYKSIGGEETGRVLFTGYFEPLYDGRLKPDSTFRFPIYGLPNDLVTIHLSAFNPKFKDEKSLIGRLENDRRVEPYYERRDIEQKAVLEGKADPVAWLKSRIDLFFLQIQGSGKIRLEDGQTVNVNYLQTNGRPYRSIGALLINDQKVPKEEMSMQRLRTYLDAHPLELDDILNYNPSYVFFKLAASGPYGCYGFEITPERSIALQKRIFPAAALAFIETRKPAEIDDGEILSWDDFSRFVLNQDTGGAIVGPGRADIFWGSGEYAELAAGHMQHLGDLYFLVLKKDAL